GVTKTSSTCCRYLSQPACAAGQERLTSMSMTTSVIICAYTQARWQRLLSAAESVQTQTTPVYEVLVVIDHNDELLHRAEHALPSARVIASNGPAGLSAARNAGIAGATGGGG